MIGQPSNETSPKSEYSVRRRGRPFTKDYRIYFERTRDKVPVSPVHDIPLYHDKEKGVLNMVVEVPRWTNAKLEVCPTDTADIQSRFSTNDSTQISRSKSLNPILQDVIDNKERFVKNCFPYKGYIWNYGAFPQTWEDPNYRHPDTGTSTYILPSIPSSPHQAISGARHSLRPSRESP